MDSETEEIGQCHICGKPALMCCAYCDSYYCDQCEGKSGVFCEYGTCAKCDKNEDES
jgi:hypothetical protein